MRGITPRLFRLTLAVAMSRSAKSTWCLTHHYGFTEEEVDFIINYDIKYRMGGDA